MSVFRFVFLRLFENGVLGQSLQEERQEGRKKVLADVSRTRCCCSTPSIAFAACVFIGQKCRTFLPHGPLAGCSSSLRLKVHLLLKVHMEGSVSRIRSTTTLSLVKRFDGLVRVSLVMVRAAGCCAFGRRSFCLLQRSDPGYDY